MCLVWSSELTEIISPYIRWSSLWGRHWTFKYHLDEFQCSKCWTSLQVRSDPLPCSVGVTWVLAKMWMTSELTFQPWTICMVYQHNEDTPLFLRCFILWSQSMASFIKFIYLPSWFYVSSNEIWGRGLLLLLFSNRDILRDVPLVLHW
jgi:hypothetical protein